MRESVEQLLCDRIDEQRAAMCELLSALVAIPSENPPGVHYAPCVSVLREWIDTLGLPYEVLPIAPADGPPTDALRVSIGRRPGATLYFHGHYDVVPAFTSEQFVPRVDGDTLFGRGSSDMKSGLVAMLFAAQALAALNPPLDGRLSLMLVPGEETGGAHGSGPLAASGELGRDAIGMLLPEPTSGVVWHSSRGAITFEVIVRGRSAHVGLAHHGVNAVEHALPLLDAFARRAEEAKRRGSILLLGGRVEAGTNFNVVPAECRFTVDRRPNPDEDLEREKRELLAIVDAARRSGVDASVRMIQEGSTSFTDPDAALGRALAEAATRVHGVAPAFEMCPGLLETRFYSSRGIPAYAYGPGILAVSHGPQEFVKISQMMACAKIYALTAARMLA